MIGLLNNMGVTRSLRYKIRILLRTPPTSTFPLLSFHHNSAVLISIAISVTAATPPRTTNTTYGNSSGSHHHPEKDREEGKETMMVSNYYCYSLQSAAKCKPNQTRHLFPCCYVSGSGIV